jgi:hypothetical protein
MKLYLAIRSIVFASLLALVWVSAALADYTSASQDFYKHNEDQRVLTALWLIATGDFNGIYKGKYTPRLHAAIESFQSREGFTPTGVLLPEQEARLKSRAETFLAPLWCRDHFFKFNRYSIRVWSAVAGLED